MKKIRTFIAALILVASGLFVLAPIAVNAQGALGGVCANNSDTGVCEENAKSENANTNALVGNIVNTLLFLVGAISVVMVIFGGILYATSQGDSGNVSKAKNTILYAIVGLVVAFIAYAIINWVFNLFR